MNAADWPLYRYRGVVTRVIDGDTIEVQLSLGLHVYHRVRVRITGIDAPELFSGTVEERAAGAAARDYLDGLIAGPVFVRTFKDGQSFNRYVAAVAVEGEGGTLRDVGEAMVSAGMARRVS